MVTWTLCCLRQSSVEFQARVMALCGDDKGIAQWARMMYIDTVEIGGGGKTTKGVDTVAKMALSNGEGQCEGEGAAQDGVRAGRAAGLWARPRFCALR